MALNHIKSLLKEDDFFDKMKNFSNKIMNMRH